jgi:hypothetical protein
LPHEAEEQSVLVFNRLARAGLCVGLCAVRECPEQTAGESRSNVQERCEKRGWNEGSGMMGLLFLAAIGLWFVLTLGLCLLWRRVRRSAGGNAGDPRSLVDALFGTLLIIWLSVSFWYGGGKTYYYDTEVKRLCAIDGGIHVYEMVTVPPEIFGNAVSARREEEPTKEYYFDRSESVLLSDGERTLVRRAFRIVRRSDNKVLGETVTYTRRSVDIAPSSFSCPEQWQQNIMDLNVFLKGNENEQRH